MFSVQSSLKIYSKRKTNQGFDCINSYFEEVSFLSIIFKCFSIYHLIIRLINHKIAQRKMKSSAEKMKSCAVPWKISHS